MFGLRHFLLSVEQGATGRLFATIKQEVTYCEPKAHSLVHAWKKVEKRKMNFSLQGFEVLIDSRMEYPLISRDKILIYPGRVVSQF